MSYILDCWDGNVPTIYYINFVILFEYNVELYVDKRLGRSV